MVLLVVRRATAADYEAVVSLSRGVYVTFDYIPGYYPSFVADDRVLLLVGEVDGQAVTLSGYELQHGDDSVALSFAHRVKMDMQKQGLWGQHSSQAEAMMKAHWPRVTATTYAGAFTDFHKQREAANPDIQRVLTWGCTLFRFCGSQISNLDALKPKSADTPVSLTTPALLEHLSNAEAKQRVLGSDKWFCFGSHFRPLPISDANLKFAGEQSDIRATLVDGNIASVSFTSTMQQPPTGSRTDVWFSGSSVPDLIAHAHTALVKLRRSRREEDAMNLVLAFTPSLDRSQILQALEPIMGAQRRIPPETDYLAAYLHKHSNS